MMAFTVDDLDEFMSLLRSDPDLRDRVRRLVLPDELLSLPELVRQNSEDIRQLGEEVRAVSGQLAALTAIVEKHDARLARIDGRLGSAEGDLAEQKWQRHFTGRFGGLVQRAHLAVLGDLDLFERAYQAESITEQEASDTRNLDLVITGTRGRGAAQEDVVLAVEVSVRIESSDIVRAQRRAATLRKVGYNAIPVVAGALIEPALKREAEEQGVSVLVRPEDLVVVPPDSRRI
jgi:hypothetical protein